MYLPESVDVHAVVPGALPHRYCLADVPRCVVTLVNLPATPWNAVHRDAYVALAGSYDANACARGELARQQRLFDVGNSQRHALQRNELFGPVDVHSRASVLGGG